jgi:acyl carrier protein
MSLSDRVQQTIAATLRLRPEAVGASASADDLPAWDSLGHVNIMMALEQSFDLYVEVEDFDRLRSVDAIVRYLQARGVS